MLAVLIISLYIVLLTMIVSLLYKNRGYKNRITGQTTSAILNPEELLKHAADIALKHTVSPKSRSCAKLLPRMDDNYRYIIKAYKELNKDVLVGEPVIPAAEWLFDNYYIVEEQVKGIRVSFPKGYYAMLPCLTSGLLKGFPRVYDIVLEIISHTDGRVDEKIITDFIRAYQSKAQLTSGELWALSIMLKIALLENIRRICEDVLQSQNERSQADSLADDILLGKGEYDMSARLRIFLENRDSLSTSFAEQLLKRIRRHGADIGSVMHIIDEKLASQDTTTGQIIQTEHQNQAQKQVSIGNSITSLRLISSLNWNNIFESVSPVEMVLKTDPAGVYGSMDFASRDYYRHIIEEISRRLKISEVQVARKAIECSFAGDVGEESAKKHAGYYIAGEGRSKLESILGCKPAPGRRIQRFLKRNPAKAYLFPVIFITLVVTAALVYYGYTAQHSILILVAAGLSIILPVSEIAVGLVNWSIVHVLPPSFLPKLELKEGIPENYASMVVIPTLLPNKQRVMVLLQELEVYYLANQEPSLYFALLGDFPDAGDKDIPDDDSIIRCALDGISELNRKYASSGRPVFYFFHRFREYNPSQGVWMGWERKRGKLMEFNCLLRGMCDTGYYIKSCDMQNIPFVKYVITLDADTELPRGAAKRLIGTIAHPLNNAVIVEGQSRVVQGYGILQPRISISVTNSTKSRFARIFAGQGGIDPYTTAVSDVYQDLFGEGIYTGKGIYDVDVFMKALDGYIPENAVLSHDLLEGAYARVGLVTDIELVDGFPSKYSSYTARMHRWTRGDWQLLPWMAPHIKDLDGRYVRNPLSVINRWKIFDNLRRSLIPPSLMVLLLFSFSFLPGSEYVWLGLTGITIAFPILTDMVDAVFAKSRDTTHSCSILSGVRNIVYQIVLMFIFLPYRAYLMCDAIIRTLVRLLFTKRNMLEWETAADAEARLKNDLKSYIGRMAVSPVFAVILFLTAEVFSPSLVLPGAVISVLWFLSPIVACWVSQNGEKKVKPFSEEDIRNLRMLSRKIWRYFEEFAGSEDNYLPPDNYQENPANGAAHRTSPTNIGLGLLAVLSARDMGYINTSLMIDLLERIFSSLDKLDMWKGHFYNWYNTKTLQPLKPLYISTVDSGNLAGYLIVLKEGIREYIRKPLVGPEMVMGLYDTLKLLNSENDSAGEIPGFSNCSREAKDITDWSTLLDGLMESMNGINDGISPYIKKLDDMLSSHKKEIDEILPWAGLLKSMPESLKNEEGIRNLLERFKSDISPAGLCRTYRDAMTEIAGITSNIPPEYGDAVIWLKQLKLSVMNAYLAVNQILSRLKVLIEKAVKLAEGMDFRPLFDERRQLFSIGFSAEDEQLNRSYYDLLASESRQTSFIAIAKGDIDQKHWFRLSRSLTSFGNYKGLVSWSGTMFEYLMPLLIMKNYKNTLLDKTYDFAMKSQIYYGNVMNVPWGVSESGFYSFDINRNYQYKAFGVPRLGLKRGLINDMVVAPYASILALMVCPNEAVKNLNALKSEGMEGPYGFYEAADYTAERVPAGKTKMIVKSYMVHHHGMSLAALDNILNGNIMQQRFHSDPHVKATELLLQEKVPGKVVLTKDIEEETSPHEVEERRSDEYIREITRPQFDFPEAHILSNGMYFSVLAHTGSGYSGIGRTAVTRWREDYPLSNYGMFIYIKNVNSNNVWSAAYEPYKIIPEDYRVTFSSDKVDYFRVDGNIDTHTEVVISPEDNVEVRRVSLTNHSDHTRTVEVTSYFEVVMSSLSSDISHPAFNNLFIRTEFVPEANSLLATRRPRTAGESISWLLHSVTVDGEAVGSIQYETDRSKFIGRNRDTSDPTAEDVDHPLSNSSGAVLDPVMSLRRRVRISAGETVRISYITGIFESRESAIETASKYGDSSAIKRTFELAWTRSQVETRYLNLKSRDIELFQRMIAHIIYISPLRRKQADVISMNTIGQSGLWPYGISGDWPIVLVSVSNKDETDIVYQMLKAHEYWRSKGFMVDLVIVNEEPGDYMQEFQNKLMGLIYSSHGGGMIDRPGGIFLRQSSIMSDEGRILLYSAARIVFKGDEGTIWQQLKNNEDEEALLPPSIECNPLKYIYEPSPEDNRELMFFNGLGGFSMDGGEYVIKLGRGRSTPAPWINVVCSKDFGFIISENGAGYTWADNSRENKLTPWSNDPVTNPPGEVIYFRDDEDNCLWTCTPIFHRENSQYIVRHGFGYTAFEHSSHGIKHEAVMFVPENEPVKIIKIKLRNMSGRPRHLSAVYYIRPVLGVSDQITSPFIITDIDETSGVLTAKNTYSDDFPGRVLFIDSSIKDRSVTCDRREFLGSGGSLSSPEGLKRKELSGRLGAGYDPCAAIMVKLELKKDEEKIIAFTLGEGIDKGDALSKAIKYRDLWEVEKAFGGVRRYWNLKLGTIKVKTPDESLDTLVNGWLMYQTICCRLYARSAFYQSGGAYGFRDQLQDCLAVSYISPDISRVQILLSAAHQFKEGDVMHWWHPVTGKGIRTRFSDDLLWLPYVVHDYVSVTGDEGILDEVVPYLQDEPLLEGEDERYGKPDVSSSSGTIYEHCIMAIERSLKFGVHGIPLIGSGDWNDGMNTVGNKGKGESIWLGWFLYSILNSFASLCRLKNDDSKADEYIRSAEAIAGSIEKNGWDGSWYRRAYFDDGTPLGSASNTECQIDSLAQSWSIISGGGRIKRTVEAMGALEHYLINRDTGLIKLLTPPFDKSSLEPGYIKGYVPGVRENGGQYTHAAIWVIMAYAMLGSGDKAWELFHMINPVNHALTPMESAKYKVEPYVMAADVYAVGEHEGRGGWTWYTGAAGWTYRVCIEHMLGLKLKGCEMEVSPCIPENWKEYSIRYRYMDTLYIINIKNLSGVNEGVSSVYLDNKQLKEAVIPLVNDKTEHRVEILMG